MERRRAATITRVKNVTRCRGSDRLTTAMSTDEAASSTTHGTATRATSGRRLEQAVGAGDQPEQQQPATSTKAGQLCAAAAAASWGRARWPAPLRDADGEHATAEQREAVDR